MTVPDEATAATFDVGSGGQSAFPISFHLFAKADIQVTVGGVALSQADFTFVGSAVTGGFAGGTVTLNAAAVSERVVIWREVAPIRTSNFQPAAFIGVGDVDSALNRLTAQNQDARHDLTRAIRLPPGETTVDLPVAAQRAQKYLYFDSTGSLSLNPIVPGKALYIDVQDFEVEGDGVHDDTAGILAAEASATAGQTVFFPSTTGGYRFTGPLTSLRQNFSWQGADDAESFLWYDGVSTTIDLLSIGSSGPATIGVVIKGLGIKSKTKMTAGNGIKVTRIARSLIDVMLQGQDAKETWGNNLWNGIWFNQIDQVEYVVRGLNAQSDGVLVNGTTDPYGCKSDLTMTPGGGRIADCLYGLHCAGGFGGLNIGAIPFSANGSNMRVTQALVVEGNREIFCDGTGFDITTIGASIILDDPDGASFHLDSGWVSGAWTHGVWVKRWSTSFGVVLLDGDFVNNGQLAGSFGDGVRVDCLTRVHVRGCPRYNAGYGVNPTIDNHLVSYEVRGFNNALGQVNVTHPGIEPTYQYWMQIQILSAKDTVYVGDSLFGMRLIGGMPTIFFDANDYAQYDRTQNFWLLYIGGSLMGYFAADGLHALGTWNGARMTIGSWQLWDDGTHLRTKRGNPANSADGTIIV